MAGRDQPDLQKMIGFFVNTVILRNDLSGNPTFKNLIQRVKETCIEAHQHQEVPFEMIVDALQLEREGNKNPIFQILFIMQKTGDDVNLNLPNIKSENILINRKTTTFDITFNLTMTETNLSGEIQYNTQKFSENYFKILTKMASEPDTELVA